MDKKRKALSAFVKLARRQGFRPAEIRNLLLEIGLAHRVIDQVFDQIGADTKPIARAKSTNGALVQKALKELRRILPREWISSGLPLPPPLPPGLPVRRLQPLGKPRKAALNLRTNFEMAMGIVLVILVGLFVFQSIQDAKVSDKKSTPERRLLTRAP